jgi:hypothetical protein
MIVREADVALILRYIREEVNASCCMPVDPVILIVVGIAS